MLYSKLFKQPNTINKLLSNLACQSPKKGILQSKKSKSEITIKPGNGIIPAIFVSNGVLSYKKGDLVSLSCYYPENTIFFQTNISRVVENRIVVKKPYEIALLKQRGSERYNPISSDNIRFLIPSINKTFTPINIGIGGISILSQDNLGNNGLKFSQCIIKTGKRDFLVEGIICNYLKDTNGYWNYNIKLLFSDTFSFFNYIEWIHSLLHKEIFTPSCISTASLRSCYKNAQSILISNDSGRDKDIYKELEYWAQQGKIGSLHCSLSFIKNEKLLSACLAKRIYGKTFLAQRLLCIPGLHLYDKPKLKLYASLSEMLFHHPECEYLILYKDRDIEWHEQFFREVANYAKDPSDIHLARLNFADISINSEALKTDKGIEKSYRLKPIQDFKEFFDFISNDLPHIISSSFKYSGFPNETDLTNKLLNTANHSMMRRVFKIENRNTLVAFAVCELYSDGYFINNSLDLCRIYCCSKIKNHSNLLNGIIYDLCEFYESHHKTRFRIIWENRKVNINRITASNLLHKGNTLRLVLSKHGLISLNQASLYSEGKFTKYHHLSYPQQSILSKDYLSPNSSINVISCTIHYEQKINFILLEQAINEVIRINASFRFHISKRHNHPCQYISPYKKLNIALIDFTNSSTTNTFIDFEKKWSEEPLVLFDSELFKFIMFYNSDFDSGFFIKAHHIIADAWTIGIITNEIKKIYNALKKKLSATNNCQSSYMDFLKKDFEYSISPKFELDRNYWFNSFKSIPSAFSLNREQCISSLGASKRKSYTIDGILTKEIINYTNDANISTLSFFLACLFIYMHKISHENDIAIGTTILNRSGKIEKATTGLFVSNLPIRVQIDGNALFRQFSNSVSKTIRNVLRHQKFPYEMLIQEIRRRDFKFRNLYEVAFTYQNAKLESDFSLNWHPYHFQNELLSIHLNDWLCKNSFRLDYDYQTSAFSDKDISRMHERFMNIILAGLKHHNNRVDKISLISQKETDEVQHTFNKTSMSYPKALTIHTLFEKRVRKAPTNIAVIENGKKLTYDQLNRDVNQLARFLLSIQLKSRNEFIAIFMESSIHQIIAQLGILKSGNALVPINTQTPKHRIKTMIDDAHIKTLITLKKHNDIASKLQWECPSLSHCIFLDTSETYIPENHNKQSLTATDLWDRVEKQTGNRIYANRLINSYTDKPFSVREMEEYGDNIFLKLKGYLTPSTKILEIGFTGDIAMFRLAPLVRHYHATDISERTIKKNGAWIKKRGFSNISQSILPAHAINTINENDFDIVIINNVSQTFPGYNYLRQVILSSIELINSKGLIFIGNLLDLGCKQQLIDSLFQFKINNPDKSFKTKIEFNHELFVPKDYFYNFQNDIKEMWNIECTTKIHTIKNELTEYCYDAMLHIDNTKKQMAHPCSINKNIFCAKDIRPLPDSNLDSQLPPSSLAYAIFTSGTTGKPKGVMIEHKSVVNLCSWYKKYYAISENDNIGLFIPYSFDPSIAERFTALISGATATIIPKTVKQEPEILNEFITNNNITVITLPTPFYNYFKHFDNKSLRALIVGGDKLVDFKKNSYKVYNNYGPTENTVITTAFPVDKNYKNIPIGKPIANTQIYIIDNNHDLMPVGIAGELCISGDGLSRGYINNMDSDKFVENPFEPGIRMYKTGDIAKWLPDGNIQFIGRKDDQVKLRGFRIELKEIEAVLLEYPLINNTAVILKENADDEKSIYAFFEASIKVSDEDIENFLSEHLPNYMIPHHFIQVPSLPYLPSGKLDKKQLIKISNGKLLAFTAENCFKSKIEKKLYKLLNESLTEEKITPDTRFAEMGGDSLRAIQILHQIQAEFNISIPIAFLLNDPSFTDIADFIKKQT